MNVKSLAPKDPIEVIPLSWIFEDPSTLVVGVKVLVACAKGPDVTCNIDIDTPAFVKDGRTVIQIVRGGITGNTYKITMAATLADGTVYEYTCFLPVVNL